MLETARDPLDRLYLHLALDYARCGQFFRSADLHRNTLQQNETISEAKQCQTDMLAEGNAAIEKIKPSLPKPGAQAALKDLALYWRYKRPRSITRIVRRPILPCYEILRLMQNAFVSKQNGKCYC